MTKYLITFLIIAIGNNFISAQYSDHFLKGKWTNESNNITISFYQTDDKSWNAKIVGLSENHNQKNEPLRDVYNPDPELRSRKVVGIDYLYGFKSKGQNTRYTAGNIYYYENGNNYNAVIFVEDKNTISIKGYWWFFRFLGSSKTWKRIK